MGTLPVPQVFAEPANLRADFEDLPADVCRYRDIHGQRAHGAINTLGALAGQALPLSLLRESHAGAAGASTHLG